MFMWVPMAKRQGSSLCIAAFTEDKTIVFPTKFRFICMIQKTHGSQLGHKPVLSFKSLHKINKLLYRNFPAPFSDCGDTCYPCGESQKPFLPAFHTEGILVFLNTSHCCPCQEPRICVLRGFTGWKGYTCPLLTGMSQWTAAARETLGGSEIL